MHNRPLPDVEVGNYPLLAQLNVEGSIYSDLTRIEGGLAVFAAPHGTGKSTCLRIAVAQHIQAAKSRIVYFEGIPSPNEFCTAFGVPVGNLERLFNAIPENTAIVIDQATENYQLTQEKQDLLYRCAIETRRRSHIGVMILISDVLLAKRVLEINGGCKVELREHPRVFAVPTHYIETLFRQVAKDSNWSHRQRETVINWCKQARTTGFIAEVLSDRNGEGHVGE
jgi:hypothetical protein